MASQNIMRQPAQLGLEGPVLFAEEVDDSTLLLLDPSKERYEQQLEMGARVKMYPN